MKVAINCCLLFLCVTYEVQIADFVHQNHKRIFGLLSELYPIGARYILAIFSIKNCVLTFFDSLNQFLFVLLFSSFVCFRSLIMISIVGIKILKFFVRTDKKNFGSPLSHKG